MGCFNSHPARKLPSHIWNSTPANQSNSDLETSRSWVYFKIIERNTQIFYAYNLQIQTSLRFPALPEVLSNSATAVLNGKLYVIGGSDLYGRASKSVYVCDPVVFLWSPMPSTITRRENAVAVAANGRIYVFGGCPHPDQINVRWSEVFDPSAFRPRWTAIRRPLQDFSSTLSGNPLQAVAFRHRIFLRNDRMGTAYNVTSSTWERLPPVYSNHWFNWPSSAAEVSRMFVAYHREGNGTVALRAYDPGRGLWLPLDFNPAETVQLLSVNGSLVAYHVGNSPSQLTFTVMQMQISPTDDRIAVHVSNTLSYLPESADWNFTGPGHAGDP